ncbi:MAG: tetratricopeptide repeat protein [Dysgonamonadaceae bacterium]|jgi:tetratricopeptide (TPR) repeat protein|nr:tetratricopeptide repeat protein [Dysgonamonadaceae bacterium]
MYTRKIFILLLLFQIVTFSLKAQNTDLQAAAEAYSKSEYSEAVELYKNILETSGESALIYYNIGNSYYKMNKTALAILNYERALLLNPGDKDTRFNLEIAKLQTVDKIEPIGKFFLSEWMESLQNIYGTNAWSKIGIVSFLLLIGSLVLFFFSRKIILKKIGFYTSIIWIVFIITANVFAYRQKQKLVERNYAIVFTPTVTIKSAPDTSGNDLFVLHEGTKVLIKSQLGEWSEIQIADGNIGWIKNNDIEVI